MWRRAALAALSMSLIAGFRNVELPRTFCSVGHLAALPVNISEEKPKPAGVFLVKRPIGNTPLDDESSLPSGDIGHDSPIVRGVVGGVDDPKLRASWVNDRTIKDVRLKSIAGRIWPSDGIIGSRPRRPLGDVVCRIAIESVGHPPRPATQQPLNASWIVP